MTPATFDPYHKWLGIPKGQRPPTHYQLLGIAADEQDADVIKEAALRQTAHVRGYQTGPQAEWCTRLLNEIAQARAVLLNPRLRQEYDAHQQTAAAPELTPELTGSPPHSRAVRWPLGLRPERVLAAVGYLLLLLFAFVASACLGYQSWRGGDREPANPPGQAAPAKGRTP